MRNLGSDGGVERGLVVCKILVAKELCFLFILVLIRFGGGDSFLEVQTHLFVAVSRLFELGIMLTLVLGELLLKLLDLLISILAVLGQVLLDLLVAAMKFAEVNRLLMVLLVLALVE